MHEPGDRPSATRTVFDVDIKRPHLPVLPSDDPVLTLRGSVLSFTTLQNVEGLAYRDGFVHCAVFSSGAYTIVNVMDPDNPVVVGSINNSALTAPHTNGLSGPTEIGLKDQYAIVASYGIGRVTAFDFTNMSNPQPVSSVGGTVANPAFNTLAHVRGLAIAGNFAFVSTDFDRFAAINISNPASMSIASYIEHSTFLDLAWHVALNEDATIAYVVTQQSPARVTCIDISNPYAMSILGTTVLTGFFAGWGCSYHDGFVYAGVSGLAAVNVIDPTAPFAVSRSVDTNPVFGTNTLRSHYALACFPFGDRLECYDVFNPASLSTGWAGSSVTNSVTMNGPRDIVFDDYKNFAYVAAYDGSRLTVVQIT